MKGRTLGLVRRTSRRAALVAALALALVVPAYPGTSPAEAQQSAPGVHVLGWGFSDVSAMAVVGPYLFVANSTTDNVTMLDAKTRDLVRVIDGPAYHFDDPVSMASVGRHLFVLNAGWDKSPPSLTELDARTGALLGVISGPSYNLSDVGQVAAFGHDIFVSQASGLTELDATTGKLVRLIGGPAYHFSSPFGLAVVGNDLFVANSSPCCAWASAVDATTAKMVRVVPDTTQGGAEAPLLAGDGGHLLVVEPGTDGVREIDPSTGKQTGYIPADVVAAEALAIAGPDLFVADDTEGPPTYGAVVEVSISTGRQVRTIHGVKYNFDTPVALAASGGNLYIGGINTLTEIDARSGALVGTTAGSRYDLQSPSAMAISGQELFVLSNNLDEVNESWVTELDPFTGALVRVMAGARYGFDYPVALAVSGDYLFVANNATGSLATGIDDPGSVAEIDTSTGRVVRFIGGGSPNSEPVDRPAALAVIGKHLFVASDGAGDDGPSSLAEVDIATGDVVRAFSGGELSLVQPYGMVAAGSDLVVAGIDRSSGAEVITELDASSGKVARTFSGAGYDLPRSGGGIAVASGKLFSTNARGFVDTIDLATGSVLNRVAVPLPHNGGGGAVTVGDGKAFAVGNNSVTEVSASTGALVGRFSGPVYEFDNPGDLVFGGGDLFVANTGTLRPGTNQSGVSHTVIQFPA